jgi:two-component system OmpR family response regulator
MHALIVDAHPGAVSSLEDYLREKRTRVSKCTRAQQALQILAKEPVDLVLTEVALPDMNGFELCRRIRSTEAGRHIPILFVTTRTGLEDRVAGFEAGADDYITRPFELREVALRVDVLLRWSRAVMRSGQNADLAVGELKLDGRTFRAEVEGRAAQLTPVEFELLRYLMQRAGQVVSAEQLLQEVWCYYPGTGDPAVVRVQVMNLRNKIERDRARPRFIQTVYRHGYMVTAS